ncbi:MAG: TIM-barrel domain-containing protein, partial [Myxococcota bacterium]
MTSSILTRAFSRRAIPRFFILLFAAVSLFFLLLWSLQGYFNPPPPAPATLNLLRVSSTLPKHKTWNLGCFRVEWNHKQNKQPMLRIFHCTRPQPVWSSIPGKAFVYAFAAHEHVHESRGSFVIQDHIQHQCTRQSLDKVTHEGPQIVLSGQIKCAAARDPHTNRRVGYTMTLRQEHKHALRFALKAQYQTSSKVKQKGAKSRTHTSTNKKNTQDEHHGHADLRINRLQWLMASSPEEQFFGFGEQFTHLDMKGRYLPIFVMEQGIGRGVEPLTTAANLMAGRGVGGSWHTSYAGVPQFISSKMRALFLENYAYSAFDMRPDDWMSIKVFSNQMRGRLLVDKTPLKLIRHYTRYTGRMRPLPEWITKGAIIGMQGGTQTVRRIWKKLQQHKTPISAFWLQDWVGQRITSFGKQLWWNWEVDQQHYPQWNKLVADFRQQDIRVMTYINPFLVDVKDKKNARTNWFQIAKKKGFLVKDKKGQPYLIPNTSFSAGLVDLTHPKARQWMKQIIKTQMLQTGASGWMADFGEALPYHAKLFNRRTARTEHNRYPERWAQLNREAIREALSTKNTKAPPTSTPKPNRAASFRPAKTQKPNDTSTNKAEDIVFFMRSGYTRSPKYATLFWLGDLLVTWDPYDGMKTAILGLVS